MGFFSDLKEDLSQAVNELMPGEENEEVKEEQVEEAVSSEESEQNEEEASVLEETVDEDSEADEESDEADEEVEEEETEPDETENWDLESMLENALTNEVVYTAEKAEENKGVGITMDTNRTALDETSVITAGMSITGDLVSEGSLDIIGKVTGNIDVLGKLNITGHINGNSQAAEIYAEGAKINGEVVSEGAVKIGASTVIVGNITATSAAIAGAVKGDIDVRGPVVLDASAIVMGNIKSKSVQINNGAVIEGMCSQCYADVSPTSFFEDYKMEMKKA